MGLVMGDCDLGLRLRIGIGDGGLVFIEDWGLGFSGLGIGACDSESGLGFRD